jgi:hypothetical protein
LDGGALHDVDGHSLLLSVNFLVLIGIRTVDYTVENLVTAGFVPSCSPSSGGLYAAADLTE